MVNADMVMVHVVMVNGIMIDEVKKYAVVFDVVMVKKVMVNAVIFNLAMVHAEMVNAVMNNYLWLQLMLILMFRDKLISQNYFFHFFEGMFILI